MNIICGLGNPGNEYKYTRHNIGFLILDFILESIEQDFSKEKKLKAHTCKTKYLNHDTLFLKPQTYMNLSGESILSSISFYKLQPENLIVVHDDVDLPFETIRLKDGGGTAGHNGLHSIVSAIGNAFKRVRIGIGRPATPMETSNYVLQTFSRDELEKLPDIIERAHKAIDEIINNGIKEAMNKFN